MWRRFHTGLRYTELQMDEINGQLPLQTLYVSEGGLM